MGRRTASKRLSRRAVISKFQAIGSLNGTAKALNCDRNAVRYHLKKAGMWPPEDGSHLRKIEPSCLAKWISSHPGEPLPHSIKEISELTGCPYGAVRQYLYRRRKRTLQNVRKLEEKYGSLRALPDFVFAKRKTVQPKYFYKYAVRIHPYTMHVQVSAFYEDGEPVFFSVSLPKLRKMLGEGEGS